MVTYDGSEEEKMDSRLRGNDSRGRYSGITAFRWDLSGSAEDRLIAEMGSIDLHHDNYSHNPPYTELEVIGVGWSQRLAEVLAGYGFTRHTNTEDGFVAFQ